MKKKKLLSLLLTVTTTASLCACGAESTPAETAAPAATTEATAETTAETTETVEEVVDESTLSYDELSQKIYAEELGDFYDAYQLAFDAESVSERYALMALAEARLMESAVTLPCYTRGGNYSISRVAPRTASTTLWGNDADRYHSIVVAKEFIKPADRETMKAKWNELRGTGEYHAWAISFLEENGYTIDNQYTLPYTSDPQTWDALATSRAADSEAIVNTVDGLMEYDCENNLQPALAESYEVSADQLTYTFHIRKGVDWVDSQGRKVAEVTADDFVAGMQHMMDAQGGLEFLVDGKIVNASQYISGEISDFAEVGVKAVDDYTLVYTLEEPCTYFMTMLGYNVFFPMNRAFYESKGGKFGGEFDASAADYKYGTDSTNIAYCGPYLVTNATANNTIVFKENPSYYNPDAVQAKTITWLFNDGQDPTKTYVDAKAGTLAGAGLTTATLEIAKEDGLFDEYAYISDTEAASYMAFFNLNRAAFANVNDSNAVVSPQTEEVAARTKTAMRNVHFRRALAFAADRGTYNGQLAGEDLKYNRLRNSYTPGNFVSLEEEVTVDINGTATTFAAGTYYGEIMQAQIDADGVKMSVWDSAKSTGDGYDGWYNPANSKEELALAVAELAEAGVEVSAANPIYVDLPYASQNETRTNAANAFKQSVEASTDGAIIVNLTACTDNNEWYYTGYYTDYGYEANYDIYDLSGWSPDYGDPSTYLDTFLPDYAGYMIKCIGIF